MKKLFTIMRVLLVFFTILLFNGCVKDNCLHKITYTLKIPIFKSVAEVKANLKIGAPRDIKVPGKIVLQDKYIFLNEVDKGFHIIDNTDPSDPKNIAFVDIPGNRDLAVKGNTLYADLYADLITFDITNPLNVKLAQIDTMVFKGRNSSLAYGNNSKIICDYVFRDTTVIEGCEPKMVGINYNGGGGILLSNPGSNKSTNGINGSTSRFALAGNYLYTVDNSTLNTFDTRNSNQPVFISKEELGWNIETIFPFRDKLFIGATSGMYMFNISSSPEKPTLLGTFQHANSCDPVIADDKYAFVTLHKGSQCSGLSSELDILKLNNFTDAEFLNRYQLNAPNGIAKDGNTLFICDGSAGLKVFDASGLPSISLMKTVGGINATDIITNNKIALVVATDGLYQYDYSNITSIHLLSSIKISN